MERLLLPRKVQEIHGQEENQETDFESGLFLFFFLCVCIVINIDFSLISTENSKIM